jgi:hypothetical protein
MRLEKFKNFSPLNETVQNAKAFLIKRLKDKKREDLGLSPTDDVNLTPEEESEALKDPNYIKIRDYIINKVKKPGLVYPFVYFSFAEGIPLDAGEDWRSVKKILELYLEASKNFSTFPLPQGNVENYTKTSNSEGQPGYEILYHDLENILANKDIKSFVDKIRSPGVRSYFKEIISGMEKDPAKKELYGRLSSAYSRMKKIREEQLGNGEEANPIDSVINTSGKYLRISDPRRAFLQFIDDCEGKVEGWGTTTQEFVEKMTEIEPLIKVLYVNYPQGVVVTSARTKEGLTKVCNVSDALLCIDDRVQNRDNFYSYTNGALQVNITILEVEVSNQKHMTTMTIYPDGRLKEAKTKYNHTPGYPDLTPYGTYERLIREYLPELDTEAIIDSIKKSMESEIFIKNSIKKIKDLVNRDTAGAGTVEEKQRQIIFRLGSIGIADLGMSEGEIKMYKDLLVAILTKEDEIKYETIKSAFLSEDQGGFFSLIDVDNFIGFSRGQYQKSDAEKIIELSYSAIPHMEYLHDYLKDEAGKKLVKNVLDNFPDVMEYAKRKLL